MSRLSELGVTPSDLNRWAKSGFIQAPSLGPGRPRQLPAGEVRAILALDSARRQGGIPVHSEAFGPIRRASLGLVAEAARSNPAGAVVRVPSPVPWVIHVLVVPAPPLDNPA